MGDDQKQKECTSKAEEASLATVQEVIKIYNFSLREIIRYIDALKKAQQSLTYLCHDRKIYKTVFDGKPVKDPEALAYLFTFDVVLPFLVGAQIDNAVAYHSIITDAVVDKEVKTRFATDLGKYIIERRLYPFIEMMGIRLLTPDGEDIGTLLFSAIFPLSRKNANALIFTDDLRKNLMLALSGLRAGHGLYSQFIPCEFKDKDKNANFYLLDSFARTREPIKDGDTKTVKVLTLTLGGGVELAMVYCPRGRFTMGSPDGESEYPMGSGIVPKAELGRYYNEEIPHEVRLTKGFWIGKYPVTQIQYKTITEENPSFFEGDTRPVEQVSWNDSVAFCERLNELKIAPKGYRFALPTEAQWEYACRAGKATALNNGKPLTSGYGKCPNLDEVGWYSKNSDRKTHPVMEKRPNAWGIYDMHGNVWEWCADWYGKYPEGAVTDPKGPETGENRVLRGGSWINGAGYCRSATRVDFAPDDRFDSLGFRLALVPEQKTAST